MPAWKSRARRAISLLEIVVSMSAFAVILLAGQSAVYIAARAGNADESGAGTMIELRPELDMIEADIAFARRVISLGEHRLELVVPDQDGDGEEDTIVLEWAGKEGSALTRTLNGGDPADLIPGLKSVSFTSLSGTRVDSIGGGESTERLLYSSVKGSQNGTQAITDSSWAALTCVPQAGAGATGFRVTRLRVRMHGSTPDDGKFVVRLHQASPTGLIAPVLSDTLIAEAGLQPELYMTDIYFPDAPVLAAGTRIAVVLGGLSPGTSCLLATQTNGGDTTTRSLLISGSAGASWATDNTREIFYEVYGRPMMPAGVATAAFTLDIINLSITTVDPRVDPIDRAIRLVNRPNLP